MFSSTIVSLALASSALANVFLTSPVASSVFTAGQQATISWQDDGNNPSLVQFGTATFAIYVGNAIQQTPLQTIATSVNVSSLSSISFTPSASIGPNSGEYFLRVTSQSFKNPSSPQYFEEAFSAKFTCAINITFSLVDPLILCLLSKNSLAGMSGTFNSSVQAEINGQSTAPIGVPSAAAAGSAAPAASVTGAGTTIAPASASPSATTSSTSANSAGKPVIATSFVAFVAALIGASLL
ncbi:hypothetical protein J3R83DRAFT_13919 [Lanmaoa asiatica]|nr:hypothetical protein J3R83DRAFT_13919 [Lanmaoa asiatica]